MKKIIAIMAVTIFIVVCGTTSHAFTVKSEEQVQLTPTNVVSPVAVQPVVTAAQQKEWEMKLNRLYNQVNGKKGLSQRLTNVEKEITSEDGAVAKAQTTADEVKKLAADNDLKISDLDTKVKDHEISINGPDGLKLKVKSLDERLTSLAKSAITTGLAILYAIGMVVIFSIIMGLIVWLITRKKKEKEAA